MKQNVQNLWSFQSVLFLLKDILFNHDSLIKTRLRVLHAGFTSALADIYLCESMRIVKYYKRIFSVVSI